MKKIQFYQCSKVSGGAYKPDKPKGDTVQTTVVMEVPIPPVILKGQG